MTTREEIAKLDRAIDRNRAGSNDKAIEAALFAQRGIAQLRRDAADESARLKAARRPLHYSRCQTCGHKIFAA